MSIQTLDAPAAARETLIGRTKEVGEIARLMARSRLLTLTGPIGVGKSALAVEVAGYRKAAFANGVVVVDLGRQGACADAARELSFAQHGRGVLLVLDNCDAVVEDAAVLVTGLLSAYRDLRILATSRQILQLPGEVVTGVQPLAPADACALFADRASRLDVAEDRGRPEPAVVAEICAELGGLPAAIRSAADGLRDMSARQLLRRITSTENANSVLDGSAIAAAALRQCSPRERDVCIELSAFPGSFSLAAAEYVCGRPSNREPVVDVVATLLDKSILGKVADQPGARYAMPRIFRRYGRKELGRAARSRTLMARFAGWYRDAATAAAAEFFTDRQLYWLRFLEAELPNLTAALDHCVLERQDVPAGLELATALAPYWSAVGDQLELTWLTDALKLYDVADGRRGAGLVAASRIALRSARIDVAHAMNDELGNLLAEHDDPGLRREHAEVTALAAVHDGCVDGVLPSLEQVFAEYREAGDDAGTWRTATYLAFATSALGYPERSRAYLDTSLALVSADGAVWSRSTSLWVAAFHQWRRREVSKAAGLAREALAIKHAVGDRGGAAICLELLAWTATARNQHKKAARLLGTAATVTEQPAHAFLPRAGLDHDSCVERLVRTLGEQACADAHRAGAETPFDETVRATINARSDRSKPPRDDAHPLTPRELEIARGIALGKTNREIAASLAVAKRTVEAHLENILTKLNFSARAQVAAWIACHDRTGLPGGS